MAELVSMPKTDQGNAGWISDRRLYLDNEGHVVGAKDPNRKRLLVGQGGTLSMARRENWACEG
jgi:hypothetical protein